MRKPLILAGLLPAVLWCTSASATQIVQNVSGNQRVPGNLTLFNPSIGTLLSVEVEGTMGISAGTVRTDETNLSAISNPLTEVGALATDSGGSLGSANMTGCEC